MVNFSPSEREPHPAWRVGMAWVTWISGGVNLGNWTIGLKLGLSTGQEAQT